MENVRDAEMPEDQVKFAEDEIVIVKTALKTKLYRKDEAREVRVGKWQVMLTALSEKFGIPEVRLEIEDGDRVGAIFVPEANKILAQRYSLVSILLAFSEALFFHKNQGIEMDENGEYKEPLRYDTDGVAFGLSAFKQAAPQMFETAKAAGRLCCTSVPYTDGGRIQLEAPSSGGSDDGGDEDLPPMRPDIDPENRPDRGNGHGED